MFDVFSLLIDCIIFVLVVSCICTKVFVSESRLAVGKGLWVEERVNYY